jgi:hypothetical protein
MRESQNRRPDPLGSFGKIGAFANQAGYASRQTGATLHDVYYLPVTALYEFNILHEALHTFLGSNVTDDYLKARGLDINSLDNGGCNGDAKKR